jgi:prepilin signal peptidase PulO-like enzyme (type II secretory pathway)
LYVIFEVLAGSLFALSYQVFDFGLVELMLWLAVLTLLLSLFLGDLYNRRLPLAQIAILTILCSVFVFMTDTTPEQNIYSLAYERLISVVSLTGLFAAVFIMTRGRAIGIGDVLLGVPIAVLFAFVPAMAVLLIACVLALAFYAPCWIRRRLPLNSHLPFGAFLIVATLAVFFMMKLFVDFF